MGAIADKIMDVCMDELDNHNLKIDDIHLMTYDEWNSFEKDLEYTLRQNKLDLSYKTDYSDKYDIQLSGNTGGIISSIRNYYKSKHPCGWQMMNYVNQTMIDNAKNFFKEDRYGYVIKISKDEFIKLVTNGKNTYQNVGIGSQASIIETKCSIYVDREGNLMFDKFVMIWD